MRSLVKTPLPLSARAQILSFEKGRGVLISFGNRWPVRLGLSGAGLAQGLAWPGLTWPGQSQPAKLFHFHNVSLLWDLVTLRLLHIPNVPLLLELLNRKSPGALRVPDCFIFLGFSLLPGPRNLKDCWHFPKVVLLCGLLHCLLMKF